MHDNLGNPARRKTGDVAAPARSVSVIMPTVSWTGTFERCARRVLGELDAEAGSAELVVVLDGEHAPPPEWLVRDDVRIVSTGSRSGPAVARNLAAKAARAEVLFFVDADVELADGSIELVRERFRMDAGLVALFGSYDDEPASARPVSQFRNLLHHHTHVAHPGRVYTFWSGCGAMRADPFHAAGGFDGRYRRPCIEDIELGSRLSAAGARIELEPALQCKHHKDWTVRSMVETDILHRAIPWTQMMLRERRAPASLALGWRNRASGAITLATVASLIAALLFPWAWLAVAAGLAGVFLLNARFYRLCRRKRGSKFAITCFGLHVLFFLYSTLAFAAVVLPALVSSTALSRRTGSTPPVRPSIAARVGVTP
jgi:GT2 family glycosyltransferase